MKYRVVKLIEEAKKGRKFSDYDKIEGLIVDTYWTKTGAYKAAGNTGIVFDGEGQLLKVASFTTYKNEITKELKETPRKKEYCGGWVRSDFYSLRDYNKLCTLVPYLEVLKETPALESVIEETLA